MFEMILASLLFHTSAGTVLLVLAAVASAADMRRRRATGTVALESNDSGIVVDLLTAPRASKRVTHGDVEKQSEAA